MYSVTIICVQYILAKAKPVGNHYYTVQLLYMFYMNRSTIIHYTFNTREVLYMFTNYQQLKKEEVHTYNSYRLLTKGSGKHVYKLSTFWASRLFLI